MKTLTTFVLVLLLNISSAAQNPQKDSLALKALIQSKLDTIWTQNNIPGAVLSVVKNGQIVFNKGIGYENIESGTIVDPERSLFRVASITKTFTAIAIMQLVEQGKLDLHADIRNYLPEDEYPMNAPYSFTIHHLLTHTSGMEHSAFRVSAKAEREKSLKTFVQHSLSDQVFAPGEVFYYSNKAYGVLGHLIKVVTGEGFEEYVEENILRPLGMNGSTFDQHAISSPVPHSVQPYYWEDGNFKERERRLLANPAASNLNTTGLDMATFMIAMMNPGIMEEQGIIDSSSLQLMMSSQFQIPVDKESMAYGTMIENYRGYNAYNHGGGIEGFGSYYIFFPELQLGLFMSESGGEENASFVFSVIYSILNELIAEPELDEIPDPAFIDKEGQAERFSGRYQLATVTRSTFERGQMLFGIHEPVLQHIGDGVLQWNGAKYIPIDINTYQQEDGKKQIGFTLDQNGNPKYMHERLYWTFEKIKWYESAMALRICLGGALLLLCSGLLIRPILKKTLYKKPVYWKSMFTLGGILLIGGFGITLLGYYTDAELRTGTALIYKLGIWLINLGFIAFCFQTFELIRLFNKVSNSDRFWMFLSFIGFTLLVMSYWRVNLIGLNYY